MLTLRGCRYLDYVLTSDAGKPQPFYFPCMPSFWCTSRRRKQQPLAHSGSFADLGALGGGDVNPAHDPRQAAVLVTGLDKVFRTGTCGTSSSDDVHALKEFDLTIRHNRVYCLLGPNGAGKTVCALLSRHFFRPSQAAVAQTLLSLLTGLIQPSDGEATICGHSIEDMDAIRELIGVCPQHDVLWPDLTAREHLAMFADIKGTPPDAIPGFVDAKLHEILLQNVDDVPSSKFSGGMKRRLSIGISSIGDPAVIFMDEPTTGTDPGNRRMIWNLIEKIKKDKCIILTTHAMDEADLLSDEIGIMLSGRLFCTGNALSLKNEFGLGFRLQVQPQPHREIDVINLVEELIPAQAGAAPVVVDNAPGSARTFLVPKERALCVARVLETLEEQLERDPAAALAKEFSVSHSTLEEVFMSIVRAQRAQSSVATASTGHDAAAIESGEDDSDERGFVSLEQSKLRASTGRTLSATSSAAKLAHRTGGWRSQVQALVHKNYSFQKRQRCSNFCQVAIPAILLFVVVIIQHIVDSTYEAKSHWEVKRNVPKEVDVENLIPAMVRELELDQQETYLNEIGQFCYSGQRNDEVELYCASGNISQIVFASFGQPTGQCGAYLKTEGCHAPLTGSVIARQCIGEPSCLIEAHESTFADWDPSGCVPKFRESIEDSLELRVQVACSCPDCAPDNLGGASTGFGAADAGLRNAIDLAIQQTEAGEELQALVDVGVSDLVVTAIGALDFVIGNGAITTEQIDTVDFGMVDVADIFSTVGVDLEQQAGDALAARLRSLNSSLDINLATLLGRDNLTFTSSELMGETSTLNDTQLSLLEQAGLASFASGGVLADIPIDVGAAVGLEDGTSVSVGSDELAQALSAANITLAELLGFTGNASQVDLSLDIVRGNANGTQFYFTVAGEAIDTRLDVAEQIMGTLPVLFGGSYGDPFDAETISETVVTQLDRAGISNTELLIENSVEAVIANFFIIGNTPPLTPPMMFWSTPKVFSVNPGADTCRDVHGWLDQIDDEVSASKHALYDMLDSSRYNHRMNKDEFAESGSTFLTELPFAAFIFDPENSAEAGHFNYTLQVETEQVYLSWWLPVQLFYGVDPRNVLLNFVDSSIVFGLDGRTRIDTEIQAMDFEYNEARQLAVADQLAYILFPFALTFLLPVFMGIIVYEKEAKLKELMKMSGMQMKHYWAVNYCYNYCMYVAVVLAFSLACWAVEIRLWMQTDFVVLFLLLFCWGHALVSLSFLLTTVLDRDLTSSLSGYVVVVAGVLASLVFNATVFYREQPPVLYMLYAPLAFYRAIYIMTTSCSRFACLSMDDVGDEMLAVYFYLCFDAALYWLLFLYLDKVVPSKFGVPEHPLFFLRPLVKRWRARQQPAAVARAVPMSAPERSTGGATMVEREMEKRRGRALAETESADSRQERETMASVRSDDELAVQMYGLRHEYDRGVLRKQNSRVALVDLFLSIAAEESQALLGPNGAGKSTLISILTGLFTPTAGSASVAGLDIRREMEDIHKLIGICPQFSILWEQLTCAEHLLFFARLKGVAPEEQAQFVSRTLEKVGLGLAADRLAKNLSGGMKVRTRAAVVVELLAVAAQCFVSAATAVDCDGARRRSTLPRHGRADDWPRSGDERGALANAPQVSHLRPL